MCVVSSEPIHVGITFSKMRNLLRHCGTFLTFWWSDVGPICFASQFHFFLGPICFHVDGDCHLQTHWKHRAGRRIRNARRKDGMIGVRSWSLKNKWSLDRKRSHHGSMIVQTLLFCKTIWLRVICDWLWTTIFGVLLSSFSAEYKCDNTSSKRFVGGISI